MLWATNTKAMDAEAEPLSFNDFDERPTSHVETRELAQPGTAAHEISIILRQELQNYVSPINERFNSMEERIDQLALTVNRSTPKTPRKLFLMVGASAFVSVLSAGMVTWAATSPNSIQDKWASLVTSDFGLSGIPNPGEPLRYKLALTPELNRMIENTRNQYSQPIFSYDKDRGLLSVHRWVEPERLRVWFKEAYGSKGLELAEKITNDLRIRYGYGYAANDWYSSANSYRNRRRSPQMNQPQETQSGVDRNPIYQDALNHYNRAVDLKNKGQVKNAITTLNMAENKLKEYRSQANYDPTSADSLRMQIQSLRRGLR